MDNFAKNLRTLTKIAMRSAWVHTGALRAPVCIQGEVMVRPTQRVVSFDTFLTPRDGFETLVCLSSRKV